MGTNPASRALAVEPVEHAAGHAAMQRADHGLVLRDRFAIGAVAEHVAHVGAIARAALRGEPERGQASWSASSDGAIATLGRDLAADLVTGGLDVLETAAGPGRAREPLAELLERLRAAAGRARSRGDGPFLARPAARLRDVAALEQPDVGELLQLNAHRVRVAADASGQLLGAGRTAQLRQCLEEPRADRVREDVVVVAGRDVHQAWPSAVRGLDDLFP